MTAPKSDQNWWSMTFWFDQCDQIHQHWGEVDYISNFSMSSFFLFIFLWGMGETFFGSNQLLYCGQYEWMNECRKIYYKIHFGGAKAAGVSLINWFISINRFPFLVYNRLWRNWDLSEKSNYILWSHKYSVL